MSISSYSRAVGIAATLALTATAAPALASTQQHAGQAQMQRRDDRQDGRHGDQRARDTRPSQATGRYRIVSTVNIRSDPGTNTRRVGQLRAGRFVQVDQVRNGWLHIRGQGWISGQFARRA